MRTSAKGRPPGAAMPDIHTKDGGFGDVCTGWLRQAVLTEIKRRNMRILLTLDNLDAILQSPVAKTFVGMLKSWHQQRWREEWRQLGLVLVAHNRIFTYLPTTPFNVGSEIVLSDFRRDHLSYLNDRYQRPADDDDLGVMENLLGGHPYLSQTAFKTLSLAGRNKNMADLAKAACNEEGVFGNHLSQLRKVVFDAKLDGELKQVLTEGKCAEDAFYRLQHYGLVRREDRTVEPRCGLYARYFERVLEVGGR